MTDDPCQSRRRLLTAIGTTMVTSGLAGCTGEDEDTEGDTDGSNGGEGTGGTDANDETVGENGDAEDGGNSGPEPEPATGDDSDNGNGDTAPDGDPGGDSDDSNGDADGDDVQCEPLTTEYTRYAREDSPFVATFEHPGEVWATATFNNEHSLTIRVFLDTTEPFDFFPIQRLQGTESPTTVQLGEGDGLERVHEIEFGGETIPVIRAEPGASGDDASSFYENYPHYILGLPHEGSAGKQYYRFTIRGTVQFADGLEPPVCVDAYKDAARHLIDSLESNPGTTVEDEGV